MIVAIAGQIASGKSTISAMLAEQLEWPLFSFGKFVGVCAERIGLDGSDRETKQDLGACLAKRPTLFCKAFLEWAGRPQNMIVDGLRHSSVYEALRGEYEPSNVRLVFIDTPEDLALIRHQERNSDQSSFNVVRQHASEGEIEDLKNLANWVLMNSDSESLSPLLDDLRDH